MKYLIWMMFGAWALLACGGSHTKDKNETHTNSRAESEKPEKNIDPKTKPHVIVDLEKDQTGSLQLSIQNHDSAAVHLAPAAILQSKHQGKWKSNFEIPLRLDCSSPAKPSECFALAPGAELRPPSYANHQCACQPCAPLRASHYRALLQSCAQTHTYTSPIQDPTSKAQ